MVRSTLRLLRDSGGGIDAAQDYSVTTGRFFIAPPTSLVYKVRRLSVFIRDSQVRSSRYGNINPNDIVNGVSLQFQTNLGGPLVLIRDMLDGYRIKTTSEWAFFCETAERQAWGGGDDTFAAHFESTSDAPGFLLRGQRAQSIAVVLNDDFSGLVQHHFSAAIDISADEFLDSTA